MVSVKRTFLVLGGCTLAGLAFGAMVHEVVTRINGQTGESEGTYGAILGLGVGLALLGLLSNRT